MTLLTMCDQVGQSTSKLKEMCPDLQGEPKQTLGEVFVAWVH